MIKKRPDEEPTVATGIDDDEELDQDATEEEVEEGDYTQVTRLVWDEYDPSLEDEEEGD